MNTLCIYIGMHDSTFTVMQNNIIKYYLMEERFSRIKKDSKINNLIKILEKNNFYEVKNIIITVLNQENDKISLGLQLKTELQKKFNTYLFLYNHHLFHAYSGFYSSNFDKALCIVADGAGSNKDLHCKNFLNDDCYKNINCILEQESVFLLEKNNSPKILYKKYYDKDNKFEMKKDYFEISNSLNKRSPAHKYSLFCFNIGYDIEDAGKVMGLSQYKNYEDKLPQPYNEKKWKEIVDRANKLQKNTQQRIIDLILEYRNKVDTKNVIISGGYAMNCVANYEYLKYVDADNLWIDPVGFDAGQSIGTLCYFNNYYSKINKA